MSSFSMEIDRDDLIYTAGIIDGEGNIGLNHRNNKNQIRPVLAVANTDKRLMDWLQTIWGGQAYPHDNKRVCLNGKPLYQWRFVDANAIEMIKLIKPYLKLKKDRADLVLHFWDLHEQYGVHRGIRPPMEYYEKTNDIWENLRKLNLRGVISLV